MQNKNAFFLFLFSLLILFLSKETTLNDYTRWIGYIVMIIICIVMFISNKNSKLKVCIILLYFLFITIIFFK